MTRLFHVKQGTGASASQWRIAAGLLLPAALLLGAPVGAALNKCIGADGKATFSDQPCPPGSSSEVLKEPPRAQTPAAGATRRPTPSGTDTGAQARATLDRVRDRLPPECAAVLSRLQEQVGRGSSVDPREVAGQMPPKCNQLVRDAMEAETSGGQKLLARVQACEVQRKLLSERRGGLSAMDPGARAAFHKVEQEVAQNCR